MSDESKQEAVVQDTTEVEREVIEQMAVASLEQLKSLPIIRKQKAVPFEIPGTGMVVKIAPTTASAEFKASVQQLRAITVENDEEKEAIRQVIARGLLKACVVEPELDDEALDALQDYNASALTALLNRCHEISHLENVSDTTVAESFS